MFELYYQIYLKYLFRINGLEINNFELKMLFIFLDATPDIMLMRAVLAITSN